jgi:DNA-3-methyladenine glycosylase I
LSILGQVPRSGLSVQGGSMDNKKRCQWVPLDNPLYVKYHDEEWGVPIHDDRLLFEFLVLEGMQAGLSWLTILRKRENFRTAFDHFNPREIALYNEKKIEELMQNGGIIRNRLKIVSAVQNAKAFLDVQAEFGSFDSFIWQFVEGKPIVNQWKTLKEIPAKTPLSDAISKELKKRGFRFVGSTIIYAHMQATGMVNDHTIDCFRYKEINGV